ncbi:MAG: hypothetical protein U9R38_02265 [Candidatus Margulisiibacteriota bacterium]|nr:hypothetical protein [Candidatus Margulisiibacteriota bacterium]
MTAAYAAKRSSSNYGIQSDGITQVGSKGASASYILRVGNGTDLGTKEGSANFTAWGGYTYQTNTKPGTPESLDQYKDGGVVQISWPAGWTNTTVEVFKADMDDPDPGDILTLQVEIAYSGEAFTNSVSGESSATDYSGTTLNASVSAGEAAHGEGYIWQARVKDLENYYSDWVVLGGSPNDYRADFVPPLIPEIITALASPDAGPTYVYLSWTPTTDALSGLAGYNVYRTEEVWGTGYYLYFPLLTDTATDDSGVSLGNNYYYVIAAQDNAGNISDFSNEGSAPHMKLTRSLTTEAPISGGYSGDPYDPVPGSTITYTLTYLNDGFARSSGIEIADKVPPNFTEFLLGSATGETFPTIQFSSDEGLTWDYTPFGTYVDPNVTNVKWLVTDESSGAEREVEFGVVIR